MSEILFSIITVTFNDYNNLVTTFNSVENQVEKRFEWIVVDGASTDNTVEFLKKVRLNDYTYVSEKDNGLYDAMNKGINIAKGGYLIFLNAGDIFSDVDILLKVGEQIFENNFPDFLFADSLELSKGNDLFYRKSRSIERKLVGMFTHHQAMFYKNSLLQKYSIVYDQRFSIAGDYEFTLKYLFHSDSYKYLPFPVCTFQQGGLSHRDWRKGIRQQHEIRKRYMRDNIIKLYLIYIFQILLHIIRFNFTSLYNIYRFSKWNK